jgi:hypothetical protein
MDKEQSPGPAEPGFTAAPPVRADDVPAGNAPAAGETYDAGYIPEGVKGWNWGAFVLGWIWGVCNGVPLALLQLIPFAPVGIGIAVWLGLQGNELAWKGKRWESVEQFQSTQRKWHRAAMVVLAILAAVVVVSFVLPLLLSNRAARIEMQ